MNSENRPRRHWGKRLLKIPFIAGALLIKGALVMLLWNALIPDLFHGPEILYHQALGLMVLAKLLFGFGFGFRHFGPFGHGHHFGHMHGMRRGMWHRMSDEERQKLREEFHAFRRHGRGKEDTEK